MIKLNKKNRMKEKNCILTAEKSCASFCTWILNEYHAVCFDLWCYFLNDRLVETVRNSVLLIASSLQK